MSAMGQRPALNLDFDGKASALSGNFVCWVQLKWELGSPVLGLILRRYAPHDTYEAGPLGRRLWPTTGP